MSTYVYDTEHVMLPEPFRLEALRRIFLELRHHGATPEEIKEYQATTWFPWLRNTPAIQNTLPQWLRQARSEWCEPQIVIHLPDEWNPDWVSEPHIDVEPPWAEGRKYEVIVGVALTDQYPLNGCIRVMRKGNLVPIPLKAGAVLLMQPKLPHCTDLNLSSDIRVMVYWRALPPKGSGVCG